MQHFEKQRLLATFLVVEIKKSMNCKGSNEFIFFGLQLKHTGLLVLTQNLEEHLPDSLGLDGDQWTCADCATGRRIKPLPFRCLPSNLVHESDQMSSITYGFFSNLTTVPLGLTLDSNHSKTLFQTARLRNVDKPRDLQKTLDPTPGKLWGKERHEPPHPHHCPHHWQGNILLGDWLCLQPACTSLCEIFLPGRGGPYWTDKALKAPLPCQPGSGTVCLGVSSPAGLPARVCPGKQRKCIAFHFNKSQMMPFANYQNGVKVKNPLNYNTCHGPKLLWLTVLWEIH